MRLGAVVQAVLLAAVAIVGAIVAVGVPPAVQLAVYVELRNTAGILFGVIGIWIAVLYAPGLHALWSSDRGPEEQIQYNKVRPLLTPLIYCVVVLLGTVPAGFIHAIAVAEPDLNTKFGQIVSVAFLGFLVALQMLAVLFTVLPALDMRRRARIKQARRERRRRRAP